MTDGAEGVLAIGVSVATMMGTGVLALLRFWADRAKEGKVSSAEARHELTAERDRHRATLVEDFDRYHGMWKAEAARCDEWERRCRIMDGMCHDLRRQLLSERMVASIALEKAGAAPLTWPEQPPIPRLEAL